MGASYGHPHEAVVLLVASYFEEDVKFAGGVGVDGRCAQVGKDHLLAGGHLQVVYSSIH